MTIRRVPLRDTVLRLGLENATWLLLAAIVLVFASLSPGFLSVATLESILFQSASIGITAVGMTFVLLTAGIDLSIGALMYLAAAIAGKLLLSGDPWPLAAVIPVMLAAGALWGALLGACVTFLGIAPFLATLAALFLGRGLAHEITQTRPLNLPEAVRSIAVGEIFGVPVPIVLFVSALVLGHFVLRRTPFGRQLYAIGDDATAARKVGVPVQRVLLGAYTISGICAALAAIVTLAQLGAVSPTLGEGREFDAIAAAVLGGTSLFGGRGSVLPGALLGTVLIQTIYSGLTSLNADPYSYPVITATLIFIAVLVDSTRERVLERRARRKIRAEEERDGVLSPADRAIESAEELS